MTFLYQPGKFPAFSYDRYADIQMQQYLDYASADVQLTEGPRVSKTVPKPSLLAFPDGSGVLKRNPYRSMQMGMEKAKEMPWPVIGISLLGAYFLFQLIRRR